MASPGNKTSISALKCRRNSAVVTKGSQKAVAACYRCRRRKVRCDASILGQPCTNCRLDGRGNCVLRPNDTPGYKSLLLAKLLSTEGYEQLDGGANATEPAWLADSYEESFLDLERLLTIPQNDIALLQSHGCLNIPKRKQRDDFIRQYFLFVHPCLPIIDEARFWRIYLGRGETPSPPQKISILVFQALLLASCPFVSSDTIRSCGFTDKCQARKTFYMRAKLLYDLGLEKDAAIKTQGAVLLTYHTPLDEPGASAHWIRSAMDNVTEVESRLTPFTTRKNVSLCRRLKWAVVLRDRILALGRHQSQLLSVDMGTLKWLKESDFRDEMTASEVYAPEDKRFLLNVLQAQCRLATILTDVVALSFPAPNAVSPLSVTDFYDLTRKIELVSRALSNWKVESHLALTMTGGENQKSVRVLVNLTLMFYESARMSLAHYGALLVGSHLHLLQFSSSTALRSIARELGDAVGQITQIMGFFASNCLTECIPLSVLAHSTMPMVLNAIDVKLSRTSTEMLERKNSLDYFAQIISRARTAYDVTDYFSDGTNHLLRLAYAITKELFLSNAHSADAAALSWSSNANGRVQNGDSPRELAQASRSGFKVRNWTEGLLEYPLAYLRISVTVDYCMAKGFLPGDDCLPPMLRDVTTITFQTPKLPLPISCPPLPDSSMIHGSHAADRTREARSDDEHHHDMAVSFGGHSMGRLSPETCEVAVVAGQGGGIVHGFPQQRSIVGDCLSSVVSLDYFDFGSNVQSFESRSELVNLY